MARRNKVAAAQDKPWPDDDCAMFQTRAGQGNALLRGTVPVEVPTSHDVMPPDPTIDGAAGPLNRLGWTAHPFGQSYRRQPFRGQTAKPPVATLNSGGAVGFTTRSQRLRNRLLAAYTDQLPSQRDLAADVLKGGA